MSEDESRQVNRRNVLKATGATVTSALAASRLPENVSASETASDDLVERALESDRVAGLASALGELELGRDRSVEVEITADDLDRPIFRQAVFFVRGGALAFTVAHSGRTDAKFYFEFDRDDVPETFRPMVRGGDDTAVTWTVEGDGRPSRGRGRPPRRYASVPAGTEAMLIGTDDGDAHFRRLATEGERALLARVDGVSLSEESTVVVGSDIGGFAVVDASGDGVSEVQVTPATGGPSTADTVTATRPLTGQVEAASLSTSPSIQNHTDEWYNHPCFGPCAACGGSIGSCITCSPACAGSPTGVGLVACAACLFIMCHGVLVATCAACADCFSDHPP